MEQEQRLAVIDMGSNSFRLVVYTWTGSWWKRTDEIFETVRIGAGLEADGTLRPGPVKRALSTLELFAAFCRSTGIEDVRAVATSAIRDASNQADVLARVKKRTGLDVRVLSRAEEARYGYIAAVNSTTLADGVVLDIGGGSMQLTDVAGRIERRSGSWPFGAVRMTERFLADGANDRPSKKQLRALRAHVVDALDADAAWLADAGTRDRRLVGIGGTVRNLAAAAQAAEGLPSFGVQGFRLSRSALDDVVDDLLDRPAAERGSVRGIKPGRGEIILAGALVVQTVLEHGGFTGITVTESGLREGVFFEHFLAGHDPPLFEDVRRAGVCNLASMYGTDFDHVQHVATLSLQLFGDLAAAGLHPGDPDERDLLWAAAMLHDIGVTVDYDDHHKHSRYLILNAGLPGFSPREIALIAQMARYHRKGSPGLGEYGELARDGDADVVARCSALLRVAEQLERARDQVVRRARVSFNGNGKVKLELEAEGDVSVARWAAQRQSALFERAFGKRLCVVAPED